MHDKSLRQDQISAAKKFLSLLDARVKLDGDFTLKGSTSLDAPSMVAASAVLDS